ncbi:MAG TPA: glycosyltransferase family 39 protein [Candidatus Binatia bacterium]
MQPVKVPAWLTFLLVVGCALVAAATMFPNLSYGLPFYYHPDEVAKLFNVKALLGGAAEPDFRHPHFMLFFSLPYLYAGKILGADPFLLLFARASVATLGAATVCLLFFTGRFLAGPLAGLSSALIFATAPLAVVAAHDFKEDIPLAFWLTLQTFFLLRYLRRERARDLWFAAVAVGIAVGTKYTALLSLPLLIGVVVCRRKEGKRRWQGIGIVLLLSAAGFLLSTPDILWRPARFLDGVAYEFRHAIAGHLDPVSEADRWEKRFRISPVGYLWTYHLRYSLLPGLSTPGLLLALIGALLIFRRDKGAGWLLCAGLALYYFAVETLPLKTPPFAARYIVPVLPFVALLAGSALSFDRQARAWLKGLACCLLAATLISNGYSSYRQVQAMRPDTRDKARVWILRNIPYGAQLMIPGFEAYSPFGDESGPAPEAKRAYEFVPVSRSADEALRQATSDPRNYVVVSSFTYQRYLERPEINPEMYRFYRALFERHTPLARFEVPFEPLGFHNPTILIYHPAETPLR